MSRSKPLSCLSTHCTSLFATHYAKPPPSNSTTTSTTRINRQRYSFYDLREGATAEVKGALQDFLAWADAHFVADTSAQFMSRSAAGDETLVTDISGKFAVESTPGPKPEDKLIASVVDALCAEKGTELITLFQDISISPQDFQERLKTALQGSLSDILCRQMSELFGHGDVDADATEASAQEAVSPAALKTELTEVCKWSEKFTSNDLTQQEDLRNMPAFKQRLQRHLTDWVSDSFGNELASLHRPWKVTFMPPSHAPSSIASSARQEGTAAGEQGKKWASYLPSGASVPSCFLAALQPHVTDPGLDKSDAPQRLTVSLQAAITSTLRDNGIYDSRLGDVKFKVKKEGNVPEAIAAED